MNVDLLPSTPLTPWTTLVWDFESAEYEGRDEQLWLAFQPVLSLRTGRIVGTECLLRWAHPKHGPVSPADFIPLMEHSGMILRVGEMVLRRASEQQQAWKADGLHVRMAVNVSATQMRSAAFAKTVESVLVQTGIAPRDLVVEITESMPMEWKGQSQRTLAALSGLGVGIVIDDFGSGFGSLIHLQNPLITGIKIDRCVVADVGDRRTALMLRHVLKMANALGLSVVAEGVETSEQIAALRAAGIVEVQGFFFSPGVVAEKIPGLRAPLREKLKVARKRPTGEHS